MNCRTFSQTPPTRGKSHHHHHYHHYHHHHHHLGSGHKEDERSAAADAELDGDEEVNNSDR